MLKLRPALPVKKFDNAKLRKSLAVLAGLGATFAVAIALHATGAGADIPRNSQHIPCPHPAAMMPAAPYWT
ncbi:hypothetical protein [Nocardia huaxiensis]|uniref:Uncharacterized protein n=1 Tax=Nocardia huaxiensis TaxID=2755382 RepID=A0A7D6VCR6_9NOCA|nr:hypothetical protein [Nocardia huaxiensis]QLY31282.1 hypothetical protein H0264_02640 [Nocardia huaxiensis]UFS94822.1 hypothetical protein LPY97_29465 [Nocardia huaxiensis]